MSKTVRKQASDEKLQKIAPYKRHRYQLDELIDWQEDHWNYL